MLEQRLGCVEGEASQRLRSHLFPCFCKNLRYRYFTAVIAFAFFGGGHEGIDFLRFCWANGWASGFKKFHNRREQGVISFVGTEVFFALGGASGAAVAFSVFSVFLSERSGSRVVPNAFDDHFSVRIDGALYGLATGSHGGEQTFATVDTVPKKFWVGGFDIYRAEGFDGFHLSERAFSRVLSGLAITQRGRTEYGDVCFFGFGEDADDVGEGGSDGFVDEDGFAGEENRTDLFEVDASVVGLKEDGVDFGEEGFDGVDDFDVEGFDFFGVFRNAFCAAFDVLTSFWVGSYDADAFEAWFVGGIFWALVEGLRESDGVGGVESDDADADFLGGWGWCGLRSRG